MQVSPTEGSLKKINKAPDRLLPMSGIYGIVARLRQRLRPFLVIAGISVGSGHVAGDYVQSGFRSVFDSDLDKIQQPANDKAKQPSKDKDRDKKEKPDFLDKIWKKIADSAHDIDGAKDFVEMFNFYKKLKSLYNTLLSYADKTAYWLPFILVAWLMSKLCRKMYNLYQGPIDPLVVANIERLQTMMQFQAEEIDALKAELIKLSPERLAACAEEAKASCETAANGIEGMRETK